MSHRTRWSEREDALLIRLYRDGVVLEAMHKHGLRRTERAINSRVTRLRAIGEIGERPRAVSVLKQEPVVTGYDQVAKIREATRKLGEAYHAAWMRMGMAA